MYCKNCRAQLSDDAKFCPECGTKVDDSFIVNHVNTNQVEPQASTQEEAKEKKKGGCLKTALKGLGILVILGMIGSCMSGDNDKKPSDATSKSSVKAVVQLNSDQLGFLKQIGISEVKNVEDHGGYKSFTYNNNTYRLYTNASNGITKITKVIDIKEWIVWSDDHGKYSVPENDGKYIIVDIDNLVSVLDSNAARASKLYKGVNVKFTGSIANIDSDGDYFSVAGRDTFLKDFFCRIKNKEQLNVIMNKTRGSQVMVKGKITDVGEVLGYKVDVDEVK